jgi:hypothetical protein
MVQAQLDEAVGLVGAGHCWEEEVVVEVAAAAEARFRYCPQGKLEAAAVGDAALRAEAPAAAAAATASEWAAKTDTLEW